MLKRLIILTTLLLVVVFVMPLFTVLRGGKNVMISDRPSPAEGANSDILNDGEETLWDAQTTINVELSDGSVATMTMSDYIFSVLGGEMEPTAPLDALKAQVVAIRTFALRNIERNREWDLHESGADICAHHTHCLAFRPRDEAMERWAAYTDAEYNQTIFERAIRGTDGMVLLYRDAPILAVYHAISAGHTENIVDVWGGDHPYLSGVESAGCADADGFASEVTIAVADFRAKALVEWPEADLSAAPDAWITGVERSTTGGIMEASVGGVSVRGVQLRNLVGLRSANFTISVDGDGFAFSVRGWGHGVGMSQQGAIAMATDGSGWREILAHYYPGATLST
ncbi:MAG: stage II sporulation protein D [Oscillospiraceae bacterium]|nr:stage II sporulation protein D [Oscillospiraceae bacterium]